MEGLNISTYFVCYSVNGNMRDTTVDLTDGLEAKFIPNALRQRIHPNRPGDRSDGLSPQRNIDCVIINYFRIE